MLSVEPTRLRKSINANEGQREAGLESEVQRGVIKNSICLPLSASRNESFGVSEKLKEVFHL